MTGNGNGANPGQASGRGRWVGRLQRRKTSPQPDQTRPETLFQREGPTRAAFGLANRLSPPAAEIVSRLVARTIVTMIPSRCRGALANLRYVLPEGTSRRDRVGRAVVYRMYVNAALGCYHFFRNVGQAHTLADLSPPVRMSDGCRSSIEAAHRSGRGLLLVGSHTSGFDLAGLGMTYLLPTELQVLSLANPTSGYRYMNTLRNTPKGFVTPISGESLRRAMQRLRQGGIVMTNADRPIPTGNQPVRFFGRTAMLPTGYVKLSLATNALVMPLANYFDGEAYWILGGPSMELERTGDRTNDVRHNAERILAVLEKHIRRAPDQWMVFEPVFVPENRIHPAATASATATAPDERPGAPSETVCRN